jgi:hypothetical protein
MHSELFDYAPIMTQMEKLQRRIHDNFLKRNFQDNIDLTNDLLFQARALQVYVKESSRAI